MTARWPRRLMLATMTVVAWLALVAAPADAQVFHPRGKTAATSKAASKKAPPPKPAAAVSRSPTRAPGPTPRRVGTTKPASKSSKARAGKARHDDDVKVRDDDDDDVKIIDDD